MPSAPSGVTRLLQRWTTGDPLARDQLIPLVYDRLRRLAHQRLREGFGERSLDTTALVHEAYLRLADAPRVDLPDRAHFLALASRVMRNLLVDRARARMAAKRGGGVAAVELDEALVISDDQLDAVGELDEAIVEEGLGDSPDEMMALLADLTAATDPVLREQTGRSDRNLRGD